LTDEEQLLLAGRIPRDALVRRIGGGRALIVDEIGYLPISRTGAMLFFQLMSRRYEHASTVLTSNKGFEEWGEIFGDEVMAGALIDRLVHHCHIVNIRGNSYRMRHHAELHRALGTPRQATRPYTPPRTRSRTKEATAP
jgi:DNA replication protein DnaC